ncbi:hypothetical protein D3C75_1196350 [compost metagenome]
MLLLEFIGSGDDQLHLPILVQNRNRGREDMKPSGRNDIPGDLLFTLDGLHCNGMTIIACLHQVLNVGLQQLFQLDSNR